MRLSTSKGARADLDEIWVYIATETSVEAAIRVNESLARTFSLLRRMPFAGRSREQDLARGLRSIPSGRWVVFYRIEAGAVRVVRVLDGSRDFPAIFG